MLDARLASLRVDVSRRTEASKLKRICTIPNIFTLNEKVHRRSSGILNTGPNSSNHLWVIGQVQAAFIGSYSYYTSFEDSGTDDHDLGELIFLDSFFIS